MLSRERRLSQNIMNAVDECAHIATNKERVLRHIRQLRKEVDLLRKLRRQCRDMQRERGEVPVTQNENDDIAEHLQQPDKDHFGT